MNNYRGVPPQHPASRPQGPQARYAPPALHGPPPAPPQPTSTQGNAPLSSELSHALAAVTENQAQLISILRTTSMFPEQFRAGVLKYPDRYPFPMVLQARLLAQESGLFGITNAVCRGSIQVDVDNPTFLQAVSFSLYKPVLIGPPITNTGLVGVYLPLSGQKIAQFDPALTYQGRDFQWRVQTASDDRIWQTGWRPSDQANGDERKGYVLYNEYELRRNDTLIVEAQPIGAPPDPTQAWELEVYLHVYKMVYLG